MAGVRVQHTLEAIGAGGVDGLVAVDQRLLAVDHRLPVSTTGVLREQAEVYRREGRWLRAARGRGQARDRGVAAAEDVAGVEGGGKELYFVNTCCSRAIAAH